MEIRKSTFYTISEITKLQEKCKTKTQSKKYTSLKIIWQYTLQQEINWEEHNNKLRVEAKQSIKYYKVVAGKKGEDIRKA